MNKGMQLEKKEASKEAMEHYLASILFTEKKYQKAMMQEIKLIKKMMTNG